jgi:hypothetical protein
MEELIRNVHALKLLGMVSPAEVKTRTAGVECGHVFEHLGLPPPGVVLGHRRRRKAALRRRVHERDDTLRFGEGQRLEQHRVDDRKNRRVGANTERQRGYRRGP